MELRREDECLFLTPVAVVESWGEETLCFSDVEEGFLGVLFSSVADLPRLIVAGLSDCTNGFLLLIGFLSNVLFIGDALGLLGRVEVLLLLPLLGLPFVLEFVTVAG